MKFYWWYGSVFLSGLGYIQVSFGYLIKLLRLCKYLLLPNGAPLLRTSTAVSWHYLYNNGLLGLVRDFIKKCLNMFFVSHATDLGFKKNKYKEGSRRMKTPCQ